MKLIYSDKSIGLITTYVATYLKDRARKIYYAVLIKDCNRYSSIASKQYVDIIMINNDNTITSFIYNMHPNTVFEDKKANHTILLPINYYKNIIKGDKINIEE